MSILRLIVFIRLYRGLLGRCHLYLLLLFAPHTRNPTSPHPIQAHVVTPFFEVDIELEAPQVVLHPSLDEIQVCINRSAQAILR
jgi:hypothetical protein